MKILVCGAGGFIGHALVKRLKAEGHLVRAVDLKFPEFEPSDADAFLLYDLRDPARAQEACRGIEQVYQLAADMGGIGFISGNRATIAHNNTLINLNMLKAARTQRVDRFLFSSSACVYNTALQVDADVMPLKEEDAWPALPERGYGLEKLYAEELCDYHREEFGLSVRVVRFHNVYGPVGTYDGGREKAPAAACRKVAMCPEGGEIEVWGDGQQTRSFMYIEDCLEGLARLMASDYQQPLNLGTEEMVTIDQLYQLVGEVAGKKFTLRHDLTKPQGVRGRNSDNTKLKQVLGWSPQISLRQGLEPTYRWIAERVAEQVAQPIRFAA